MTTDEKLEIERKALKGLVASLLSMLLALALMVLGHVYDVDVHEAAIILFVMGLVGVNETKVTRLQRYLGLMPGERRDEMGEPDA